MNQQTTVRPAWREPMVWLVAGLPALGVIAGILIVVAAVRAGGADALSTQVRRTGQIQQENLAPDLAAARAGLVAELQLDAADGRLSLSLSGRDAVGAEQLQLRLIHSSQAQQDREITLQRSGARWIGQTAPAGTAAWTLRLQPPDGSWRLGGRLPAGAGAAQLQALWQP
ncbi:FixH family protein [Tahibacter harae]|uniref:FixH family protein n=1 Tax=Tahibacter harae TaxID=2963937 RepID=A0ABT1QWH8_9GAMM|nr:FixH family protein [Tahibacter harae]MCQ4166643.1 FixH family protein [Tahibacter harae]